MQLCLCGSPPLLLVPALSWWHILSVRLAGGVDDVGRLGSGGEQLASSWAYAAFVTSFGECVRTELVKTALG